MVAVGLALYWHCGTSLVVAVVLRPTRARWPALSRRRTTPGSVHCRTNRPRRQNRRTPPELVPSVIERHVGEVADNEDGAAVELAEREALGQLILVVPECWSEGAVRVQRQGMIQPVLLEFRHEQLYWSWWVRAWHALEEIAVVLAQVEESWM